MQSGTRLEKPLQGQGNTKRTITVM